MRKVLFLGLVFLGIFNSCDRGDSSVSFRLKYESSYEIPSSTGINFPLTLQTPPVSSNSSTAFSNNNTSANLVNSISMDYAEIVLLAPEDGDFSFLESIRILINAEGLNEIELASLNPVPPGPSQTIVLETSKANFKDYLTKEEFELKLETVSDEFLTEDHQLQFNCEFLVSANVLRD